MKYLEQLRKKGQKSKFCKKGHCVELKFHTVLIFLIFIPFFLL